MVAVTFGDSSDEYHMLLDSAASNTWVMGQDCSSEACKTHATFGKGDSSTLETDETTPFSVTYGTGSSSGHLATDTLHIGTSLSVSLTFGLATNVSDEFRAYPMDGILGIGRGTKGASTTNEIDAPQIMDILSSQKLIGAKLYGIHLSRDSDDKLDGELNLGEVNQERFNGDLNYLDCVDNESGFWEVLLQDAGVDNTNVNLTSGITNRTAIMDTGTSFILIPEPDALAIHSKIEGFEQDGETFFVPCDTKSVVQFTLNSRIYNISTADWVGDKDDDSALCRSNIIGRQTFGEAQWLVGDVFLKNVYSVFDFEQNRVGLGVLGEEQVVAGTESVTSTGSASPSASKTTAQTGGASSTSTGGSGEQAQDQQGSAAAAPSSAFLLTIMGAFTAISMCI
jgi:hypothetical protein